MMRFRNRLLVLVGLTPAVVGADISIDQLKGEAFSDIGQIVKGYSAEDDYSIEGSYLSRLGVVITATDTIKEKLLMKVGVGGLFWQPYPNPPNEFWKNNMQFGPGITEASAAFMFTPNINLKGGYFPFKYDTPAMDLGEYLIRSESYPTVLYTGGWTWVDSAYTRVLGFRLSANHFGGKFHHELGLYAEFQNPPLFDLTPAYLFSWQPFKGIEIGGGVALRRWFSNNNTLVQKDPTVLAASQYVEISNFPEVQNQATIHYSYDDGTGNILHDSAFAAWRPGASPSVAGKPNATITKIDMIQDGSSAGVRTGIKSFLMNTKNCDETGATCTAYYKSDSLATTDAGGNVVADQFVRPNITKEQDITRQAINLMGRVNIDFAKMLDVDATTGPFKVYAELAVLGLQNQPVYYEKLTNRMPIMVGVDVPTFGILDLLAVEGEYLSNPYKNSALELGGGQVAPLPSQNMAIPDLFPDDYTKRRLVDPAIHGDDVKWSVHAIRSIVPGLKVKVQVANDHIRLTNFEATPTPSPLTYKRSDWYYLVHLQWGF